MIGTINVPVRIEATGTTIQWSIDDPTINLRIALDSKSASFTPSQNKTYNVTVVEDGVPRVVEVVVGGTTPTPTPEPTPIPTPTPGTLIYNSDVDIDWSHDQRIDDIYGTFTPNGKYFRMKASGKPRMYIVAATKELILEHDGDFGRAYFGVCNYNARLECEFKLDSCSNNASFKIRNRHQYKDVNSSATDAQRQGGMGNAYHCNSVENDLEIVHGTGGDGLPGKALLPKLEANKWYKMKFSVFDKNGKLHVIDELDRGDGQGFKIVNEGDVSAPSQFFNKAEFESWSEFWIRLNAVSGGKLYIKNIKLFAL